MKKFIVLLFTIFYTISQPVCANNPAIKTNESVLLYDGGFFISNAPEDAYDSDGERIGYILYYKDGKLKESIGHSLRFPTAMAVYKDKLFISDRLCICIFNLKDMSEKPKRLDVAPDVDFINDMVIVGNDLYVTVTDKDAVYRIDLKRKNSKPEKWLDVPTPNGIAAYRNTVYIASMMIDENNPKNENVIYVVKNRHKPKLERFNELSRRYDGLGISKDGKTVYVSDWITSSVYAIDTSTKKETVVYHRDYLTPADITFKNDILYIPDMINSRVILYNIKTKEELIIK